jgi:hypothetical protein
MSLAKLSLDGDNLFIPALTKLSLDGNTFYSVPLFENNYIFYSKNRNALCLKVLALSQDGVCTDFFEHS